MYSCTRDRYVILSVLIKDDSCMRDIYVILIALIKDVFMYER